MLLLLTFAVWIASGVIGVTALIAHPMARRQVAKTHAKGRLYLRPRTPYLNHLTPMTDSELEWLGGQSAEGSTGAF